MTVRKAIILAVQKNIQRIIIKNASQLIITFFFSGNVCVPKEIITLFKDINLLYFLNILEHYWNRLTNRDLIEWQKLSSIDIVLLSCTFLFSYMNIYNFSLIKKGKNKVRKEFKMYIYKLRLFF